MARNPSRHNWLRHSRRTTDLASGGFGTEWGHTRSFASRLTDSDDMGQGFNWQVAQWPYLARIADADGNLTGVVVMGQATSNLWFDLVDGQFVARFSATETLVYYPDELVYRLTDLSGNVTEFGSFDIIASGMFLSRTDSAGNVIQVVSLADNGGNAAEVQRSDGSLNIESYLYDYGSPGGDGTQG